MIKIKAFHLLELLIVLAILSIVSAVSLPLYSHYLFKAHRLEAITELNQLALALEQYGLIHHTYIGATLENLKVKSMLTAYQLKMKETTALDFKLAAIPKKPEPHCGTLILSSTGERTASGKASFKECWT